MPGVVVVLLVGCLALVSVAHAQIFARMANPLVSGLEFERVAFLSDRGQCTDALTDVLVESFIRNGVEVLDRQNTETLLLERYLGGSFYVSDESIAALEELLGPTALVVIRVERCAFDRDRAYTDVRTRKGIARRFIARTDGYLRGSIRVVDLATSRISTAARIDEQHREELASYEGWPGYPSPYDVQDVLLATALAKIHRLFFPWTEQTELHFFNDEQCGLKDAYKLLKVGDGDGAARISRQNLERCEVIDVKEKFRARAYDNVGMTHFILGEYEHALDDLQEGYMIQDSGIIAEAIEECRHTLELGDVSSGPRRRVSPRARALPLPASLQELPPERSDSPVTGGFRLSRALLHAVAMSRSGG